MEKTTEKAALNNSEKAVPLTPEKVVPLTPKKAAPLTPKKANTTPASEVPLVICEDKSFRLNFLVSKKSSKDIDKLVTEILNHRITNPNSIMQYDLKTKRLSLSGEPPIVLPFVNSEKKDRQNLQRGASFFNFASTLCRYFSAISTTLDDACFLTFTFSPTPKIYTIIHSFYFDSIQNMETRS